MLKKILYVFLIITFIIVISFLYIYNYIPHKKYTDRDFDIPIYVSSVDKDNDGLSDNLDIIDNAYKYIETKPKYKSKYYANGYPDDEYGVCTDVVNISLLKSGYDMKELVNADIIANKELYNIDTIDKNIDFRRVKNLDIYFKRNAINLTTDINKIEEWNAGDIVVFKNHIGLIADVRNSRGIPFVIHHANPYQSSYIEDILMYRFDIIGHYRIS